MSEDNQLETTTIAIGETVRGALMKTGEEWPTDLPVWTCSHRHEDVAEVLACAEAEIRQRVAQGSSTPSSKDLN